MLTKYGLSARADGLSPETVKHVKRCVRFFDAFMGGIQDVRKVEADDLRRFTRALQGKTKWAGTAQASSKCGILGKKEAEQS